MIINKAKSTDSVGASVQQGKGVSDALKGGGVFAIKCYDKDGNLKWEDRSHNLVVNVGLADMNDKYFSGSGYTAAWYILGFMVRALQTTLPLATQWLPTLVGQKLRLILRQHAQPLHLVLLR
jgi:hypothetical protein